MSFLSRLFKPSQDSFAKRYLAGLRGLGDDRDWRYDKANYQLVAGETEQDRAVVHLATMYAEYCSVPRRERAAQLQRAVMAIASEVPLVFEQARSGLMPAIKHRAERANAMLMLGDKEDHFLALPLTDELEVALVYDTEFSMARMTTQQLGDWGVSADEAFAAAMDNLRDRSGPAMGKLGPGLYASEWGDYLDASRLLLNDLIYRHPVHGAPVIMVPNRTCLLLTGDKDEQGLGRMLELASEVLQQPRPLSSQMLRLEAGRWAVYVPPELAEPLAELAFADLSNNYAVQKELLDAEHERTGTDVFVASFMAIREQQTERLFSVATWSEGVPTLLPQTDTVALAPEGAETHTLVAWADLQRVCGDLLVPTDDYPARFQVVRFPSAEQLDALARCAVD